MPTGMRRAALAVAITLAATPAVAGECWVATRASPLTGAGDPVSKPAYARIRGAGETVERMLRSDPRLNSIPGFRYQANHHITLPVTQGGAFTGETRIGLHAPKVWGPGCTLDQGRADYMTPASITVSFNNPGDLSHALPSEPGISGFPLDPEAARAFERTGVIAYNGAGVRLYRPGGVSAILPVRVRDHLDAWERELRRLAADGGGDFAASELASLRARRAGLSSAQLDAQAAVSSAAFAESMWGYATVGDEGALPLYRIAPDLLAPVADKGALHVVVALYSVADAESVPEAGLRAWLEALDLSPLDSFFAR